MATEESLKISKRPCDGSINDEEETIPQSNIKNEEDHKELQHDNSVEENSIEPSIELHVWEHSVSAWIPWKVALKKRTKMDKKSNASAMSKKFGGLDDGEIAMYQALAISCTEFYGLEIAHDILMVILTYSQGYKFEDGEKVFCFPHGLFRNGMRGKIVGRTENEYKIQIRYGRSKKGRKETRRVPFNHVFSGCLIIINADKFNKKYKRNMQYGDVLYIHQLECVKKMVYSKKKKRKIQKMKVVINGDIIYDVNLMLGAKYKQIHR